MGKRQKESPSMRMGGFFPALLVAVITFVGFWPVLGNGFVSWDDPTFLLQNVNFRGLSPGHFEWMFTTAYLGPYQPLAWLTFAVDYLFWGLDPFGYHLTSLLFHAGSAALAFFFVSLILSRIRPEADDKVLAAASVLAALFFSLHPMRVEAVAWASARNHVVGGFLAISALICYLKGSAPEGAAARRWRRAALAFYCLSLFSKAIAISLPLVFMVIDIYPLRRLASAPKTWFSRESRAVWFEKVPYLAAALIFAVVTLWGQSRAGAVIPLGVHGWAMRLAQSAYSLVFYLLQTLSPWRLVVMDESALGFLPTEPRFLAAGAVVVLAVLFAAIVRRRWPGLTAVCAAYALMLFPFLGLVKFGSQLVADRYSYLPCLALAVLVGGALLRLLERSAGASRALVLVLAGGLIVGLGAVTWARVGIWHDSETLYRSILAEEPGHTMAHNNLGVVLVGKGRLEEAELHFRKALSKRTHYVKALNNLGALHLQQGQFQEAVEQFEKSLVISPRNADAHTNLGAAWLRLGKLEKARLHSLAALETDPENSRAMNTLGLMRARQGDLSSAIEMFDRALIADPGDKVARRNLSAAKKMMSSRRRPPPPRSESPAPSAF